MFNLQPPRHISTLPPDNDRSTDLTAGRRRGRSRHLTVTDQRQCEAIRQESADCDGAGATLSSFCDIIARGRAMTLSRRRILRMLAGTAAGSAAMRSANAHAYPTRPVHIVAAAPPGNGPDTLARLVGARLSDRLGQRFIVDNRPGADDNIGIEFVVRAPPDGYTLLLIPTSAVTNASLYPNLSFNFIRDIAPVACIGRTPFVLVITPSLPVAAVPEFIAYAKANPTKINMASSGIGSGNHVFGALFALLAGVEFVHVPYRGSYMPDLLAGRVQICFSPVELVIEPIRSGKLRALAVTTTAPLAVLPDVPAMNKFLPDYEAAGWNGVGAPKNAPGEIIELLNARINAVIAEADIKSRLGNLGIEPVAMTPAEFGKLLANETEKWSKVIREAHIKAE
jgi:tripartite-type tricarboxylate transporter receptor subunit TctC